MHISGYNPNTTNTQEHFRIEIEVEVMECDLQISNPEILDTLNLAAERAYPTPYVNSPLLPLLILTLMRQRMAPKTATTIQSEYDYIVVGAGAGGSSVAARLSEVPSVSVLVVEAGKAAPVLSDIPALSGYFLGSDLDWQYQTVPQKNAARALVNRQIYWPSGKGLGGSSLIGAAIYQRGNRKIYDDWVAQGATGWSFEEVLPYILKSEDNWDYEFLANGYHSIGGPSTVQRPGYRSEIECPILETALQMGYDFVDTNGPQQTGFSDFQGDMGGGQRCNAAEDYLVPAENRTNLDILANARVTKVLIDGKQAVGVQFDYGGSTYKIKARREVILSAGTINTAQLLMNSGIGPKKHLQKLDIPVIADLPVGNNLQDHSVSMYPYLLDPSILTPDQKLTDLRYLEEYISNRTGPLSSLQFVSVVAFLPRESDPPSVDFPSQQMHAIEVTVNYFKQISLLPEVYEQFFAPYENQPIYLCVISAIRPKSRGVVRLRSADPYDPPLIDPNYLADPSDVKDVIQGLKTCHRIATSEPLQGVGSRPFETLFPGCEQFSEDDDNYFECVARSLNIAFNHAVGTAKMGDPADPTTVVDPQLSEVSFRFGARSKKIVVKPKPGVIRAAEIMAIPKIGFRDETPGVYVAGVKGLRVVDASVIPNANPYIATVMIGEKAADMIKETYNRPAT